MHGPILSQGIILIVGLAQDAAQLPVPRDEYRAWVIGIVIGIVSGLVATGLSIFIEKVWRALIIPWYEERVYQDARISGIWKATFTGTGPDGDEDERIDIKSKGHQVNGTIRVTKGKNEGKVYLFIGNFRNLILVGTYHADKAHQLDRGSFALLLKDNGSKLQGKCVYYSDQSAAVSATDYTWQRELK